LGYPLTGGIKTMLLRSGTAHINRTPEAIANLLANRHPQDLLEQMQAIALKILHSQRHQINLAGEFNTLPGFYFKIRDLEGSEKISLTEFSHIKLGEFLCAKALIAELKLLTQYQNEAYSPLTFVLDSPSSAAQYILSSFVFFASFAVRSSYSLAYLYTELVLR
jgi:hypothetical protein